MSVRVVPYDDDWPLLFRREAARLGTALHPWLVGDLEHVGSTAVPGLPAKPILDMLGPVADLDGARAAIPVLQRLGYRHADHRPHEALWFFEQRDADYDSRRHQLHLTRTDSALWRERIVFRDALREDASLAAQYQALKRDLAAGATDLAAYTGGKREFVARVLGDRGVTLADLPPAAS